MRWLSSQSGSKTQSPNGNRISKLITAVYKVNRQDKTRQDAFPANPGWGLRAEGVFRKPSHQLTVVEQPIRLKDPKSEREQNSETHYRSV